MNNDEYPGPDPARSRLRATVAAVARHMAALDPAPGEAGESLKANWADLVELLALGPEPELRECPSCGKSGMRQATVCGFCWSKLTPPPRDEHANEARKPA